MRKEEKIMIAYKKLEDEIGMPISDERLKQLYSVRELTKFKTFVGDLKTRNWSKFCVSKAPYPFSYDEDISFFQITDAKDSKISEIIFLGRGKTRHTTPVFNQVAAETWGFAVLALNSQDKKSIKIF